ncbi:ATP synthase j chain-domain-containing protein [Astrocystis sublimbata]|nr:ATP synthase j chain-domain-containing protein [Astrocystis sublimbata]
MNGRAPLEPPEPQPVTATATPQDPGLTYLIPEDASHISTATGFLSAAAEQSLPSGKPLERYSYPSTPQILPLNTAKMMWFGIHPLKKFPAPIMKPLAPFFAAGLVIAFGVNSAQNAMMASDEWKNDPRNPNAKSSH